MPKEQGWKKDILVHLFSKHFWNRKKPLSLSTSRTEEVAYQFPSRSNTLTVNGPACVHSTGSWNGSETLPVPAHSHQMPPFCRPRRPLEGSRFRCTFLHTAVSSGGDVGRSILLKDIKTYRLEGSDWHQTANPTISQIRKPPIPLNEVLPLTQYLPAAPLRKLTRRGAPRKLPCFVWKQLFPRQKPSQKA